MHIEPFYDERTSTLTYVVFGETTRDAVVIDPVLDFEPSSGKVWTESVERVARFIELERLSLHTVLETHVHADHLSGGQFLRQKFGAKLAVSRRVTQVQAHFKGVFNWPHFAADGSQFDLLLDPGQRLRAGSLELTAIPTPGHTPACMSFHIGDAVFTGDALFLEDVGVGRSDFPEGDTAALYDGVTSRLFSLDDATRVFTGHDYPPIDRTWKASTTIGAAKAGNVQLRAATSKAEFVEKRTARDRTLSAPRLLYPSIQVNIAAGKLPEPEENGRRYLRTPVTGL
jgi:glyoxylase-like metal-dependent hydrolase (beta-lactamase superfamily II)